MLHLSSRDMKTSSYNGSLSLPSSQSGTWVVYYSNFESGNVPWCWTGVDSLVLRDSGNVERTVTLGTLSSADDSAAIATAVTAAITGSATCALSGGKYTITLPAAHDVLWSKSTFSSVFKC